MSNTNVINTNEIDTNVVSTNIETKDRNYQNAGYGLRLLARCVDILTISAIYALLVFLLSLNTSDVADVISLLLGLIAISFLWTVFVWMYYTVLTEKMGGTFGKLIVGLEVQNESNERLSFRQSLFRHTIGYWLSALILGLGYWWIIKDDENRGWHDLVSGTHVAKKGYNSAKIFVAIISIIVLSIVNGMVWYGVYGNTLTNKVLVDEVKGDFEYIKSEFEKINQANKELVDNPEVMDSNQESLFVDTEVDMSGVEFLGVIVDGETSYKGELITLGGECVSPIQGRITAISNNSEIAMDMYGATAVKVDLGSHTKVTPVLPGEEVVVNNGLVVGTLPRDDLGKSAFETICDGNRVNGYEITVTPVLSETHSERGFYVIETEPTFLR